MVLGSLLKSEISVPVSCPGRSPFLPVVLPEPVHSREKIALVYFLRQWSGKSTYDRMFEHVFTKSLADFA